MIFSIQRYLEDLFSKRGLEDPDQYAVTLANLYDQQRNGANKDAFLRKMHLLKTIFFRANRGLERNDFEEDVLQRLDQKFVKKKSSNPEYELFPGGVVREKRRIDRTSRCTIRNVLTEFKRAIEARAIDVFWEKRNAAKLRSKPEKIAQALLATFAKGVVRGRGLILREVASGIGYIDISIILSSIPHLIEIKVLHGPLRGVSQLNNYMKTEGRKEGWLMVFDARPQDKKNSYPEKIEAEEGIVRIVAVDINPVAPSKLV
jgi:hypothetical protein